MTENMKKFLEVVSSKKDLAERVGQMSREEVLRTAEELGVALTDEDFAQQEEQGSLSDEELDCVAGGDKCGCVGLGTGQPGLGDTGLKKCECMGDGNGVFSDNVERCRCAVFGGGVDH